MAVRKQATNTKKLGFADPDRLAPEHDAMVMWLDESAEEIARDDALVRYGPPKCWSEMKVEETKDRVLAARDALLVNMRTEQRYGWADAVAALEGWGLFPPTPHVTADVVEHQWERPIMSGAGHWVVGFVDLSLNYERSAGLWMRDEDAFSGCWELSDYYSGGERHRYVNHNDITRLCSGGRVSVYRGDAKNRSQEFAKAPHWDHVKFKVGLRFEVKAAIDQVSEVIRQIRFYQVYEKCDTYFVVSPSWQHGQTLLDQGIGFVPYTPGIPPKLYYPGQTVDVPCEAVE